MRLYIGGTGRGAIWVSPLVAPPGACAAGRGGVQPVLSPRRRTAPIGGLYACVLMKSPHVDLHEPGAQFCCSPCRYPRHPHKYKRNAIGRGAGGGTLRVAMIVRVIALAAATRRAARPLIHDASFTLVGMGFRARAAPFHAC